MGDEKGQVGRLKKSRYKKLSDTKKLNSEGRITIRPFTKVDDGQTSHKSFLQKLEGSVRSFNLKDFGQASKSYVP